MHKHQPLIAALVLSLAGHLWWLSREGTPASDPATTARPVSLEVALSVESHPVESHRSPPVIQPELGSLYRPDPPATLSQPDPLPPAAPVVSSAEARMPKLRRSPAEMLATLHERTDADAKTYATNPCSVLETASLVRDCPPIVVLDDSRASFYAQLFADARALDLRENNALGADLRRMESLLQQASLLAEQQPADAVQRVLLKDQRDAVRAEIFHLDRKLAEFNLLRLVSLAKPQR